MCKIKAWLLRVLFVLFVFERTTLQLELPPVLANFPAAELPDLDCERVRSALVNWPNLRSQLHYADAEWKNADILPSRSCEALNLDQADSDVLIVLARPDDAAVECALGSISALILLLVCTLECAVHDAVGPVGVFNRLWRASLAGPESLPVYMLGTTSWPTASLLAKWQAHCDRVPSAKGSAVRNPQSEQLCKTADVREFTNSISSAAKEYVFPMLWHPAANARPEASLHRFVHAILHALTIFMNSVTATAVDFISTCPEPAAAQGTLLLLVRLLGPPVARDPLNGARLSELGNTLAQLSLGALIGGHRWISIAVLATLRHLTKRSHGLFGEVTLSDVRRVLEIGLEELNSQGTHEPSAFSLGSGGLLASLHQHDTARRQLWARLASGSKLLSIWSHLSRWFASGQGTRPQGHIGDIRAEPLRGHRSPNLVYLTSGFGKIDDGWLRGFLNRALDIQLPRLIFVTPDRIWLLVCEEVRQEQNAENNLLCIRSFAPIARPYDLNNKNKFFLIPVILTLGVDVVWLDLDIFLFKNPTHRLLEQGYLEVTQPTDILVTDHFDKHCLSHGVFRIRASDRALLWIIQYINWLHWYPFGHDRSGWEAFLDHSGAGNEPQLPEDLRSNPATNVSYGILSTEFEYVTLAGWAGNYEDIHRALLLHFNSVRGISESEKMSRLVQLFNRTARRAGESVPNKFRVQAATWKALRPLRTTVPIWKRPCHDNVNFAVDQLIEVGLYEELLH